MASALAELRAHMQKRYDEDMASMREALDGAIVQAAEYLTTLRQMDLYLNKQASWARDARFDPGYVDALEDALEMLRDLRKQEATK